ncbi:MAG: hypothetical protein IPH03_08935 [Tetrasphaera sp.]|nr:hypothetical protein [Tetrasphaera sp.]
MSSRIACGPRPPRPTAQPTIRAPLTSNQAWNHSTMFAAYGLTTTVSSVAN